VVVVVVSDGRDERSMAGGIGASGGGRSPFTTTPAPKWLYSRASRFHYFLRASGRSYSSVFEWLLGRRSVIDNGIRLDVSPIELHERCGVERVGERHSLNWLRFLFVPRRFAVTRVIAIDCGDPKLIVEAGR